MIGVRRFVVVLTVTIVALLVLSGSASALLSFPFDGKLVPPGGSFSKSLTTGSVAVDDFNGDTYVADSYEGVVEVFNSAGVRIGSLDGSTTPAGSFGGQSREPYITIAVAANDATGTVYVVDPSHNVVDAFNSNDEYQCQITGSSIPSASECNGAAGSATPAGGFAQPGGIAVDQATGRVYVVDGNHHAIDIFTAAGAYLSQISLASLPYGVIGETMRGIAVDDFNGSVYLSGLAAAIYPFGAERPVVYEFNAAGDYVRAFTGTETPVGQFFSYVSVAADNASGNLYITANKGRTTYVYDASDKYLTEFSHSEAQGTAVDQGSGKVYLSASEPGVNAVEIFGPPKVIPDVTTEAASEIKRQSVTLNGTVDAHDAGSATCEFVWGTTTAFGKSTPCSETVPNGNKSVAVHASLSGLPPDTTYYYRVQASNANGTNSGEESQDREFTTSGPAAIDGESVSDVTASSATLNATVTTHNAATNYYFQYGVTTAYGSDAPAAPGLSLGSGERTVEVSQHIQLPVPGIIYHYRVVTVAQIELSPGLFETIETPGIDMTLTTQAVSNGVSVLADGRQWEQVSPVDKHGAQIYGIDQYANEGAVIQASASGNAISYVTDSPTEASPAGYTNLLQVFSARSPGGWVSRDISLPHHESTGLSIGEGEEYRFFSEDLSLGIVQPYGNELDPSLSPEASEQTAFLHSNNGSSGPTDPCSTSCYRPLVTGAPGFANVPAGTVFAKGITCGSIYCGPQFDGATPDLSHIVLTSSVALTSDSAPEGGLYEWSDGKLELVSVLPGTSGQAALDPRFGTEKTAGGNERHAISDNGSRIFWTAQGGNFMRDVPRKETVLLGAEGEFEDASTDGSKVFFNHEMCEVKIDQATGELECPASPIGGGVVGTSDDGSWVYFISSSALAPGGVTGNNNVYVRHGDVTRFIAAVSNRDVHNMTGENNPLVYTSRISGNGRWLTFMSQLDLTGYDTRDASSGQLDTEVYLYDAEANGGTGKLVCASCNPSGARPHSVSASGTGFTLWSGGYGGGSASATIPGWTPYTGNNALYASRALSNSGRLFFNSSDALVPQDVNGTWDVYEYEPPGVGSCITSSSVYSERSSGCVNLVSSGESSEESGFLDANEDGSDVFFLTSAKLVSQDDDTALDIYDAHECSSSVPCFATPPTIPPSCDTGDACKPAPSLQPESFGAPSSATFSGAGNVNASLPPPVVAQKGLSRAQKLARALKACRKEKGKRKRVCVKQAKGRYDAKKVAAARNRSGR